VGTAQDVGVVKDEWMNELEFAVDKACSDVVETDNVDFWARCPRR
jgi:hypothetical protein